MTLKEKIIYESLRLFSLKGFLNTPIQDILQAANTSKGGFYNHFKSKEDLFYAVLDKARQIWREKNLSGINEIYSPVEKLVKLLENLKDRYLKDSADFPGGCVFITLSVELNDQRPHLSKEIDKGFNGLKNMIATLLKRGKQTGELSPDVKTNDVTEMLFAGIIGASVLFGANKSYACLDQSINALIDYLKRLKT